MEVINSNKTFTELFGDHLNNVVVIGDDSDKDNFHAHAKLEFWGEDNITFDQEIIGEPTLVDDVVSLDKDDLGIKWWQHKDIKDVRFSDRWQSQLKWELTFKKKPITNIYTLKIGGNWQDFNFWYQPPLTQKEIDGGSFRPDNVVGSYAVYHKTKRNHIIGQKNYRTGKVLHIYRPLAVDADGKKEWVAINISNGVYTAEIPQDFLDNAKYPIRINDTFGYATIGGSTKSETSQNSWMSDEGWTPDFDGSATSMKLYVTDYGAYNEVHFSMGIYNTSDSRLGLTNESTIYTNNGNDWHEINLTSPLAVTNGIYYRLCWSKSYGGFTWHYDSAGTYDVNVNLNETTPPAVFTRDAVRVANCHPSIYVVYSPGGGETFPISEEDTLTLSDTLNKSFIINKSETDTFSLSDSSYIDALQTLPILKEDTITLTDSVEITKEGVTGQTVSEVLSLSDSSYIDALQTLSISKSDTLTLTDSVNRAALLHKSIEDTLTLTDSASIGAVEIQEISEEDTLTLSDSISVSITKTRNITVSESLTLDDSIVLLSKKVINRTESLSLSDTAYIDALQTLGVSKSDTLTLTDSVKIIKIGEVNQTINEILSLIDTAYIGALKTVGISETDTITLTDSVTADERAEMTRKLIYCPPGFQWVDKD